MQNTASLTPPCPVGGDVLIFCSNVAEVADGIQMERLRVADSSESPYVVFSNGDDSMTFVLEANVQETLHFKILQPKPGFDSTSIWTLACKEDPDGDYLFCIQLPVSGRQPIPVEFKQYFVIPDYKALLGPSSLWIYNMSELRTLASWRAECGTPSHDALYDVISRIARVLNYFHSENHYLLRFNADTIVVDEQIRFLGVMSMDLPWNEACAQSNGALDFDVFVPPECRGYVRQALSATVDVYSLGVVLYYAIASANPPICEALDFECPLGPRVFEPAFPFGWDNVVLRALLPSPQRRFSSIDAFMEALTQGYNEMCERQNCDDPLTYDSSVDTYIGITKRLRCPVNQDAVLLRRSHDGQRILIVVADGVSTSKYGSGDLASSMLVSTAAIVWDEAIASKEVIEPKECIAEIFSRCNASICEYIRSHFGDMNPTASDSMGTTALVGIVEKGAFTLGSIGDSRAYLIRDDAVTCITRDHNLFTMAIVNGLPVQQCAMHPHAGSLVQCLGFFEDLDENENIAFDVFNFRLMPGDHLLLTTDGLLDYAAQDIRDAESIIARTVLAVPDPALACLELILVANRGGGGDNTGVGLIYVDKLQPISML